MIDLFVLIFFCFLVANQMAAMSLNYESVWIAQKKKMSVKFLYIVLLISMTLFSGLRTSYNDTGLYMHAFNLFDTSSFDISILFKPYGGFDLYQFFIKEYISIDSQILLFLSAFIVASIYLWFYAKHSKQFGWTILAFFILGPYVFSMAGLKQILAMCISMIAIDRLFQNKKINFIFWLIVASTFHPYIICLVSLLLLEKRVWSIKVVSIIVLCLFMIANLDLLLDMASLMGKEYTMEEMTSNTINPLRVVIESIPIIISFIYKNKLQKENNRLLDLGINMMILNGLFIFVGLFVNPIYFARIATYFSSLNAIIVPMMLCIILRNKSHVVLKLSSYFAFYFLYLVLDLTKLGSISVFTDIFKHRFLF